MITGHRVPARQRGATLLVALILLAIMTVLGLAAMRGTLLDERMTASLYDRGLAFQASEAALREAETAMATTPSSAFPGGGCNASGLCAPIDRASNPTALDRWFDPAFAGWFRASFAPGPALAERPEYFVETMGPAPNWAGCEQEVPIHPNCMTPRYRITARGGSQGRSRVVLQTNYASSAP